YGVYTSREHATTLSSVHNYEYSTDSDSSNSAAADTVKHAVNNTTNTDSTIKTVHTSDPAVSCELISIILGVNKKRT
ncbi:MAG: hypothetical protein ACRD8Z_27840, partial [Nitrososphaeraceae archaeon]